MSLKLVRRHGSKNWYIRGTIDGRKTEASTGFADRDKAEAVRARREWEIIKGEPRAERRPDPSFLDAAISYLEADGEGRFLKPIMDHFGETALERIGQAEVEACARKLYPGRKPSTVNRQCFTPIAAVMRHAAVRKMVAVRAFERPKQPKGRVRWIAPAEAERLIGGCSAHLRPIVVFLLYTGARTGEALALDWCEVDLARAHAAFLDTKNGESRGVPLHPRVVAELANLKCRKGAVFRTPDGRPYPLDTGAGGQIKTAFRGACRRAKITNFHPHDCRHTWATWYYAATRDLMALRTLGGWKSVRMVERYAHINVGHLAGSVALLPWAQSGDSAGTPESPAAKNA